MTIVPTGAAVAEQSKAKVFISYSRKDMTFADQLETALKARGFEPLIDRTEIYAFEEWWTRIEELIARADTVVFVLSPDSVSSEVALKEVAFAASINKRFAPIICRHVEDKSVPEALARLNFIFFDDEARFEQSADRLAEALETDIGWIRQHTDFGEAARRWSLANQPNGLLLRSPVLEQAERWVASRPQGAPEPTSETQAFIRQSRQAATRRRNILTGSLAAGLVLALGLAGLAYWQRGVAVEQRAIAQRNETQANEERDRAMRNFKLARQTADSLVTDIARGLRNVQGMRAETVQKILNTARETFEQLAASSPDDITLQRGRLAMLIEFGDTYGALGALDQSLQSYRDGLAIAEKLAAVDHANTTWQRDRIILLQRISNTLVVQGRFDEALEANREGLAIAEPIAAADPGETQGQRDLSIFHTAIGDVLFRQGKLDEALKAHRDSLAIKKRLAAAEPSNNELQRDLAISHSRIGDVFMEQHNPDDALKAYRDSLAIAERLAAVDPSNTQQQRDLAISYTMVGYALQAQGRLDEALKACRESLAIVVRLAAADPGNMLWQHDISISHHMVAEVLKMQGRLDEALQSYRDGLAVRVRLAAHDLSNAQWQNDLQDSIGRIGGLAFDFVLARNFAGALDAVEQAISLATEGIQFRENRAHALMFLNRVDEARTVYLQYRGQTNAKGRSWQTVVLGDFVVLRKAGLTHQLMDEIEKQFAADG